MRYLIPFAQAIIFLMLSVIFSPLRAQSDKATEDTAIKMTMEVLVTDHQDNPREGEEIIFIDETTDKKFTGITNKEGKFDIQLPGGSTYMIKIAGIGKEQEYQTFSIPEIQDNKRYGKSRFTIQYEPPKIFTLDNVYFDVNKSTLRDESYEELNELLDYLQRRPDIRIEIAGHTDNVGSEENNMELSQHRANEVKKYLVNKGIDAERIEAKGYGETIPVAENSTKEGRQKNRRTEVHIISEGEE
ncbi:MAG: OmpA family protein [Bacteroidales bacterium]